MTHYIYNEAYKSGGHWHVAENMKLTLVPEKREEKTQEVIQWKGVPKSQAVEGQRYYTPRHGYGPNVCQRCRKPESDSVHRGISLDRWSYTHAFEEEQVYPILGDVTATIITPAHKIVTADSGCGQVKGIKVVNIRQRDVYRSMTAKKNIGRHITIEHVLTRLMVESDFVPEPLCGHCFKLVD